MEEGESLAGFSREGFSEETEVGPGRIYMGEIREGTRRAYLIPLHILLLSFADTAFLIN